MKLLPSSLAARTFLLVVATVAIAEFATFSLIFQNGRATHMHKTVQFVTGQIRLLQSVLPGLDPGARQNLEGADIGEQWLQLVPDGDLVPRREARFGFAHGLGERLEQALGEPVLLRHSRQNPRGGLWIGFQAGGERWWLVLPPPRFEPQGLPRDLWQWLAATLAVLVGLAAIFVRGIVGPLQRLGEAVAATGGGTARTVLPEGPKEVQTLATQHNTMVAQLARSDAERREMLAGLTHDLRAPLARLRVRLALLENADDSAGLTHDVDDMERIVSQCLAFLRSEEDCAQPTAPLLIADAVSDEVARHAELGRAVTMTVSEAAAPCQVAIAGVALRRILDNLIGNALQYGAPPVEVELLVDRPGSVCLRVRDHGPGIPAELRERALEPFAQIEPARATRGSCGLGLAIVRTIVASCGGRVRLSNADEGGLIVEVVFPTTAPSVGQ